MKKLTFWIIWICLVLSNIISGNTVAAQTIGSTSTPHVLVGAGDIADCVSTGDNDTAALIQQIIEEFGRQNVTVFTAGDNVYENGTADEYANCFTPSWGIFLDLIKLAALGNHDYAQGQSNAEASKAYFSLPETGYYSVTIGSWDVYVLNSQCTPAGGCGPNSPMVQWLKGSLSRNPKACIGVIWHDPTANSGQYGPIVDMLPTERVLFENGADWIIAGHAHHYERFLPQTPDNVLDYVRGIIKWVAGFGGKDHGPKGPNPDGSYPQMANSDIMNRKHFGVLMLTLDEDKFTWEVRSVQDKDGTTLVDSGSGTCVRYPLYLPLVKR